MRHKKYLWNLKRGERCVSCAFLSLKNRGQGKPLLQMLIFFPKLWRERKSVVSTIGVPHGWRGKAQFHSSGQAFNSLDWEIDELNASKRHAVGF